MPQIAQRHRKQNAAHNSPGAAGPLTSALVQEIGTKPLAAAHPAQQAGGQIAPDMEQKVKAALLEGLPVNHIQRVSHLAFATIKAIGTKNGLVYDLPTRKMLLPDETSPALLEGLAAYFVGTDTDAEVAWQDKALCAQTDPEAFFPEKGGSTREAKKVCRGCDVRVECLEYALEHDERFGIWGGFSERERRRMKREAV